MSDERPDRPDRRVVNIHQAGYRVYDMEGPVQEDMGWLPLSYDANGNGCYAIRMAPGAETIEHTHAGVEDYLILEGELIESDGRVLQAGDFVHYDAGSRHNSRTETGCLLIGFDWGKPEKR
jgi:quercetin dioxygenase-like cupin family protein